ncbi:hypothetical protein BS47DRAFT_1354742, partial [Hydnum rufescens UP504]
MGTPVFSANQDGSSQAASILPQRQPYAIPDRVDDKVVEVHLNSLLSSSKVFFNVCSHRVRLVAPRNGSMRRTENSDIHPSPDTADLLDLGLSHASPGKSSCLDEHTEVRRGRGSSVSHF